MQSTVRYLIYGRMSIGVGVIIAVVARFGPWFGISSRAEGKRTNNVKFGTFTYFTLRGRAW